MTTKLILATIIYAALTMASLSFAQEGGYAEFPIRIDGVVVEGNVKTREEVILRQIPYEFPSMLNLEDIQHIQNRISNLFLFNRVEAAVLADSSSQLLQLTVTEILYIYPLPVLFLNNREWDDLSYGFQLSHINFRGLHERLSVGGWLGYNPAFFASYSNPWLGRKQKFIVSAGLSIRKIRNKSLNFDERRLGGRLALGKRFGHYTSLRAKFSVRRIRFPSEFKQESESGTGLDLAPSAELEFSVDRRDLVEYPKKGYVVNWRVSRTGFAENQPDYWRFRFDHRGYINPVKTLSLGFRNLLVVNSGTVPIYDRLFFGFRERVRGYWSRQVSAQNLMLQNVELRFNLLPIRYYSWSEAPFLKSSFQNLKYGLSMALFIDSGIVWGRQEYDERELSGAEVRFPSFAIRNMNSGFGAGLHFHLPYIYLLRFDFAISDRGTSEWIIEARTAF